MELRGLTFNLATTFRFCVYISYLNTVRTSSDKVWLICIRLEEAFQDLQMTSSSVTISETLCTQQLLLCPQEAGFIGFMRSLRGRDQVVKKKEELWGGVLSEGALHCTVCHCTGTFDPGEGPILTDVGDLMTSAKGYFWYQQSTFSQTNHFLFFMDILMGRKYTDRIKRDFMYLPKTLWLHMWEATPETVSMQYWPLLSPVWGVWNWMTPLIKDGGVSPQGSKSSSIVPALLIISMCLLNRQTPVPIFFYGFFISQAQDDPEYRIAFSSVRR